MSVSCAEVDELALGLTSGPERAAALVHLAGCARCRDQLGELTDLADRLLVVGPAVEPRSGFEASVLDRLVAESAPPPDRSDPRPSRRPARRVLVLAASVAAGLVLTVTGIFVGLRAGDGDAGTAVVRHATMATPGGRTVGRVDVGRDPGSLFVVLPGWREGLGAGAVPYELRVTLSDDRIVDVGPVSLPPGRASWGTDTSLDTTQVREVALVDKSGRVLCRGRLP